MRGSNINPPAYWANAVCSEYKVYRDAFLLFFLWKKIKVSCKSFKIACLDILSVNPITQLESKNRGITRKIKLIRGCGFCPPLHEVDSLRNWIMLQNRCHSYVKMDCQFAFQSSTNSDFLWSAKHLNQTSVLKTIDQIQVNCVDIISGFVSSVCI